MTTVDALRRVHRLHASAQFVVVLVSAELLVCTAVACGFSCITGIEDHATTWPAPANGVCRGAPGPGLSATRVGTKLLCCIEPSRDCRSPAGA